MRRFAALPATILHCKVGGMEHTRMVARLLSEVSAARTAIMVSYLRLWRAHEDPLADPVDRERGSEPPQHPGASPLRDERPSRNAG
jgi:hypothetical protein